MAQKYGFMANAEPVAPTPCLVCDDPTPSYSWTDYSGEAYCHQCGTPYQLKWGTLKDGETYPRINIGEAWIPWLRRFWEENHITNGAGTFIDGSEYRDQMQGRRQFNVWLKQHEAELPKPAAPEAAASAS